MLLLNVNYERKTIFNNLAWVGIGICRHILHILELFDSWDKMCSVCCSRQIQENLVCHKCTDLSHDEILC